MIAPLAPGRCGRRVIVVCCWLWALCGGLVSYAHAQQLTIAAASSLRPALDELVDSYEQRRPDADVEIVYGSSGRLTAQIINGAPFDVFLAADSIYPERLRARDPGTSEPRTYALGRLVLWSARFDASALELADLGRANIRRIAIAQPAVAPYGERAQQALVAAGVWDNIQSKLVFGENVAQVAQMTASGAADVGVFAMSLALQPALYDHPRHVIDQTLYEPLAHTMVITSRGRQHPLAGEFLEFMSTSAAQEILIGQGFAMPADEGRD